MAANQAFEYGQKWLDELDQQEKQVQNES